MGTWGGSGAPLQGPHGSASMNFSSSLSLLTNSCASRLVRPSSIRSADLTVGRRAGAAQAPPALRPSAPGSPLTLSSGPAQVQGDGLPSPRAPPHLGPHDAANAAQAECCLPCKVVGGQPVVIHDREEHTGSAAAAHLCWHGAAGRHRAVTWSPAARLAGCWAGGGHTHK